MLLFTYTDCFIVKADNEWVRSVPAVWRRTVMGGRGGATTSASRFPGVPCQSRRLVQPPVASSHSGCLRKHSLLKGSGVAQRDLPHFTWPLDLLVSLLIWDVKCWPTMLTSHPASCFSPATEMLKVTTHCNSIKCVSCHSFNQTISRQDGFPELNSSSLNSPCCFPSFYAKCSMHPSIHASSGAAPPRKHLHHSRVKS